MKPVALRCITSDAAVMAMAIDSTAIVTEAERIHQTSAVVTAALGRMLTAASMMGIMLKNRDDSLTLRINGGGPAGTIMAVTDGSGNVRGYAENNIVELPLRPDGKLNVGEAVGADGLLHVMRDTGAPQPYNGCVPIVSGEIAEDITRYYADSEQIPTVCALGVLVNPDLTVKAAGGLLIQLLPFCPEDVLARVEKNVANLPPITQMMEQGATPEEICAMALDGFEFEQLDSYDPQYLCPCSRDRVSRALTAVSPEERKSLPDESGKIEIVCRFCDNKYNFTAAELENL